MVIVLDEDMIKAIEILYYVLLISTSVILAVCIYAKIVISKELYSDKKKKKRGKKEDE